jgi:hypothetical protein
MKPATFVPAWALAALLAGAPAFAGAPDGAFGSHGHPATDFNWHADGTRAAIAVHLKQALGKAPNPFGHLENARDEDFTEDSKLLGDFMPHLLGVPGPEVALAHGDYFYSGAEPHNAEREGAVITQGRGGAVLALAVFENSFGQPGIRKPLTILVPAGQTLDPAMRTAFTGWACSEIDNINHIPTGSPDAATLDDLDVETSTLKG